MTKPHIQSVYLIILELGRSAQCRRQSIHCVAGAKTTLLPKPVWLDSGLQSSSTLIFSSGWLPHRFIQGGQTGRPVSGRRQACGWCPSCNTAVLSGSACHSSSLDGSSSVPRVSPHEQSPRFWKYLADSRVGLDMEYIVTPFHCHLLSFWWN